MNNKVSDLGWCDAKYNTNYGNCTEKRIVPQRKRVSQITLDGTYIRFFTSMAETERELGFNHFTIYVCCKDSTKSVYGYKWKYVEWQYQPLRRSGGSKAR